MDNKKNGFTVTIKVDVFGTDKKEAIKYIMDLIDSGDGRIDSMMDTKIEAIEI